MARGLRYATPVRLEPLLCEKEKNMTEQLNKEVFWRHHQFGREDDAWDYKAQFLVDSKAAFAEFAKDLLAFSNYGGGLILLGVEDDGNLVGVQSEVDQARIGELLERRLGLQVKVGILYFTEDVDGLPLRLGLIHIPASEDVIPAPNDLHDEQGRQVIQEGTIFFRRTTRSVRASTADIRTILDRIATGKSGSSVGIRDEASFMLALQRQHPAPALELDDIIRDRYEPNARNFGQKLWNIWRFASTYSKLEFAKVLHIAPERIDAYFSGEELLDIGHIISVQKMFGLPADFFFRASYELRYPLWQEDLVRFAIQSLVQPKSALSLVSGKGTFYGAVMYELASKIVDLHDRVFPHDNERARRLLSESEEALPEPLRQDLARQYYKLLEQYPEGDEDRSQLLGEKILRIWFSANDEYIARIIIEAIKCIRVRSSTSFRIEFRFEEDIRKCRVRFAYYDPTRLRMRSSSTNPQR